MSSTSIKSGAAITTTFVTSVSDLYTYRQKSHLERDKEPVGFSVNVISLTNRPSRNQESPIARRHRTYPSEGPPNHNIEDPDSSGINLWLSHRQSSIVNRRWLGHLLTLRPRRCPAKHGPAQEPSRPARKSDNLRHGDCMLRQALLQDRKRAGKRESGLFDCAQGRLSVGACLKSCLDWISYVIGASRFGYNRGRRLHVATILLHEYNC